MGFRVLGLGVWGLGLQDSLWGNLIRLDILSKGTVDHEP